MKVKTQHIKTYGMSLQGNLLPWMSISEKKKGIKLISQTFILRKYKINKQIKPKVRKISKNIKVQNGNQ